MYLKRLESVGFKSFAERIEIEFVPGVNAVVGPNGSGKSNIIDAVRWVLGEQSAKSLRGSKMEDIIFQGSDGRKPLNMAEVTLVLDNAGRGLPLDFAEISITRRVYRSGESEFYLNKQPCRLKDIIDLLMDSGLGREAFSIISQGRVEAVLSSKAEDRRTIFEEAAGVLKYKQRKHKAEFKLSETEDNLDRVQDIIYELEQQIGPLEEQAKTAEMYKELKQQLQAKEISLLLAEIDELHHNWKNLLAELEQAQLKEVEWKTSIQKREAVLETAYSDIKKTDDQIEKDQAALLKLTEEIEQAEGKKQVLLERTKHVAVSQGKLDERIAELKKNLKQAEEKLQAENKRAEEIRKAKEQTENVLHQLEEALNDDQPQLDAKIEDLKADYIEYLSEQAALRNEGQSLQQQKIQLNARIQLLADKHGDISTEKDKLLEAIRHSDMNIDELTLQLQKSKSNVSNIKDKLSKTRSDYQQIQEELYKQLQHLAKLKSKKEMLGQMKADLQGFFSGAKAVLREAKAGKLTGIQGAVIQLIDVPKAYLTAIETVLGSSAQHIITDDEKSARDAIAFLKRTNQGRATFLPLSVIQSRHLPEELREKAAGHAGFCGVALDVIHFEPHIKKAIEHLMGNVIIARTLKDANELAAMTKRRFRIVTLEGDVVSPGGSMTGGAQKKSGQSLFTRERDLKETETQLKTKAKQTAQLQKKAEQLNESMPLCEKELQAAEQALSEYQEQLQQVMNSKKEAELKLAAVHDNLKMQHSNQQQYEQELSDLDQREQAIKDNLGRLQEQLEKADKEIQRMIEQKENAAKSKEEILSNRHRQQLYLAQIEERQHASLAKIEAGKTSVQELSRQLEAAKKEKNAMLEEKEIQQMQSNLAAQLSQQQAQREKVLRDIQVLRETRLRNTKKIQDEELDLKEDKRLLERFMKEKQDKEIRANRFDVALENKLHVLQEEYGISHQKAVEQYDKCPDMESASQEVGKLKAAIARLGTVNLGAIEEFSRIKERYEFLTEQQRDLLTAKETLRTTISELDEEMEKLFLETFHRVQEQFSIVFKELFGGGHAELKLTDPGQLLDTGIEIIAEPPGKKLKNLNLLSGGERALTAIALLFAILRVRPVPFCILDEVEAALDESNVARFAEYLHQYSEETQFIVITHRKGTMEEADVLYGVTMEESGVSRLVSVRLDDAQQLVHS